MASLEQFRLAFFRSFFRLVVLAIGVAEWATAAWVLAAAGVRVPWAAHALGPLAILWLNRRVLLHAARWSRRPALGRAIRLYVGIAFTCVFCGLFLAAAAVPWAVGRLVGVDPAVGAAYGSVVNAGLAAIAALMLHGYTLGARALTCSRVPVAVPGLPAALDGLRIVHLTDLHIGQFLDVRELAAHVERVNALDPDVVCITGDLVDRPWVCEPAFPVLAGLRARHGVFVTLGNHDVYAGAGVVTAALRRLTDFTVLRNAEAAVRVNGAVLPVVGVDDLGRDWARGVPEHPALPALAERLPPDAPWLLLSHRPDCFAQAARLGVSLMLSGHTHGGQLALPPLGRGRARNMAEFITAYDRGVYREGRSTLYVNRGLGFTGQKIRLFTPREVACIELRAVAAAPTGRMHGQRS
jgi:predicted MPP superfamily phosphohydrolase